MCWTQVKSPWLLSVALIVVSLNTQVVDSANILGLFTSHSPSHLIVHMSVAKALAEKGHNVTVVSGLEPKVTHKNIRHIIIPPTEADENLMKEQMSTMAGKKNNIITMVGQFFTGLSGMITMQADILKDKRFTALYETPDTKFDLVIMGYFMNDFLLGVAAKFNCPVIMEWTGPPLDFVNFYIGNPQEIAYVPNISTGVKVGAQMTFLQRITNFLSSVLLGLLNIVLSHRMDKYYTELFPDKNFPTYQEMRKNVSLLFCNSHFSEGPVRPNVPALVEIGGIQIKEKPDPLPKDIADFLNASKEHGAILFSLGSNLQGSNIKPEVVKSIFRTLSSLKQNVIWKWEDPKNTPGTSTNIMYSKWLPQDDILAHPNIKLFITHAGKGGLAEALFHAVPMVALPVFADQPSNAEKIVAAGYGQQLDMLQLTEADLKKAITEVLTNPKYAHNVKEFSELYRDRPTTAKENVVFWTEYVIRHHGAAHMQSPMVHLNILQRLSVDVVGFLLLTLYAIWRVLKLIFKYVYLKLSKKIGSTSAKKIEAKKLK